MPSQPPPASPSPPARALMSVSHACACKHLSLGCFSHRAHPRGALCQALPPPSLPIPWLCLAAGLHPYCSADGGAAPFLGKPSPGGGARGWMCCCWWWVPDGTVWDEELLLGAITVAWGWGQATWGPVLHPGAGPGTGTLRPARFTGHLPCTKASLFCSQPRHTVALAPAAHRPVLWLSGFGAGSDACRPWQCSPGSRAASSLTLPRRHPQLGVGGSWAFSCHGPRSGPCCIHPPAS